MTVRRGPDGRFYSDRSPGDDTFVSISNDMIYKRIETIDDRLSIIEQHFVWSKKMWTTLSTVLITGSALVSGIYYFRGH